jgi:hypothetical protein
MVASTTAASAALTFLSALFYQKPDALYILVWTPADRSGPDTPCYFLFSFGGC